MSSQPKSEVSELKLPESAFPLRSNEWYNDVLCQALGYSKLREHQLQGIRNPCNGKDVFAIAPTGAGKSTYILGPALADLVATGECPITLTVVPTKALADDQAAAAGQNKYLHGLALHEESIAAANSGSPRRDLFKEIEEGKWTHVYLGPEMVTNRKFDKLIHSDQFTKRFAYFGVDEAHIVDEWKGFRPKFQELKRLRNRFPSKITWFGLSATVEPTKELPLLLDTLGFSSHDTDLIRIPVDRETIALAPRFLQYPVSDAEFLDLSWVIPLSAKRPEDIPITIIFVDEVEQARDVAHYLARLLPACIPKSTREQMIKQITGMLSADNNMGVVNDLRSGGHTRVVTCTSAGALGIDVKQVERVVILFEKKSTTYKMICQKVGRIRVSGLAVILFPRWMNVARTSSTDINQRGEVEPIIVEFANANIEKCPREVNATYWRDVYKPLDPARTLCCNLHNPEVDAQHLQEVRSRAVVAKAESKAKNQTSKPTIRSDGTHVAPDAAIMQPLAREVIDLWREVNLPHMEGYKTHMPPSILLPNNQVDMLLKHLHICTTFERFQVVMKDWTNLGEWGGSLFKLVGDSWDVLELEDIAPRITKARETRRVVKRGLEAGAGNELGGEWNTNASTSTATEVAHGHVTTSTSRKPATPSSAHRMSNLKHGSSSTHPYAHVKKMLSTQGKKKYLG